MADIDLNSASKDDLDKAFGIGPAMAEKIIDYREKNGPFEDWEDLDNIPGFESKTVDHLKKSGATISGKKPH